MIKQKLDLCARIALVLSSVLKQDIIRKQVQTRPDKEPRNHRLSLLI